MAVMESRCKGMHNVMCATRGLSFTKGGISPRLSFKGLEEGFNDCKRRGATVSSVEGRSSIFAKSSVGVSGSVTRTRTYPISAPRCDPGVRGTRSGRRAVTTNGMRDKASDNDSVKSKVIKTTVRLVIRPRRTPRAKNNNNKDDSSGGHSRRGSGCMPQGNEEEWR